MYHEAQIQLIVILLITVTNLYDYELNISRSELQNYSKDVRSLMFFRQNLGERLQSCTGDKLCKHISDVLLCWNIYQIQGICLNLQPDIMISYVNVFRALVLDWVFG